MSLTSTVPEAMVGEGRKILIAVLDEDENYLFGAVEPLLTHSIAVTGSTFTINVELTVTVA